MVKTKRLFTKDVNVTEGSNGVEAGRIQFSDSRLSKVVGKKIKIVAFEIVEE